MEVVDGVRGADLEGQLRAIPGRDGDNLSLKSRFAIKEFLRRYPDLLALWQAKEDLHTLYRTKGHRRAAKAVTRLTDRLAHSALPELQTFRRTLLKWRTEILNYFKYCTQPGTLSE